MLNLAVKDPISGGDQIIPLNDKTLSGWAPKEVRPPDTKPSYQFDTNPDGSIDKETAEKLLTVLETQSNKIKELETTSDGYKKAAEELETVKNQMVEMAAQQKSILGDGDNPPEWLNKVEAAEAFTDMRGRIDGMVHVLKNFKKTHGPAHIPGLEGDTEKEKEKLKKFNLIRYALGIKTGNWKDAGLEKDVAVEMARKRGFEGDPNEDTIRHAVTRGTDATGGYMFPESVMDMLIAEIVPAALPGAAGVSVINDIPRDRKLLFPVLSTRSLGGWVAEAGSIAAGSATFTQRELEPSKYAGRILVSNEALESITPGQNAVLMQALREEIEEGVSQGFISGSGASNQPKGVIGHADIPTEHKLTTAGNNGAAMKGLADFKKLLKLLTKKNTLGLPSNKWLMHQALATEIAFWPVANYANQGNAENAGLLFPMAMISGGNLPKIGGYDHVSNNYVPVNRTKGSGTDLTTLLFGPWNKITMGVWRTMRVSLNPWGAGYTTDQTDIRLIIEVGFVNLRPEGFAYLDAIDIDL